MDNIVGMEFNTKCGPVVVLEDLGLDSNRNHMLKIMFKIPNIFNANTISTISLSNLNRDKIKDPYQATFAGFGCVGVPDRSFPLYNKARQIWENMIKFTQCSPDNPKYKYYGNTAVYPAWRCFEYFLRDLPLLPNFNLWLQEPDKYVFDKDYRTNGTTNEYSPQTCMFIDVNTNKVKKAIRYAESVGKYLGVRQKYDKNYEAVFWKQLIGTFTNEIAAASMYNHCARYNHVPECNLNQLGENEMSIQEARSYMIDPYLRNGLIPMMTPFYRNQMAPIPSANESDE